MTNRFGLPDPCMSFQIYIGMSGDIRSIKVAHTGHVNEGHAYDGGHPFKSNRRDDLMLKDCT